MDQASMNIPGYTGIPISMAPAVPYPMQAQAISQLINLSIPIVPTIGNTSINVQVSLKILPSPTPQVQFLQQHQAFIIPQQLAMNPQVPVLPQRHPQEPSLMFKGYLPASELWDDASSFADNEDTENESDVVDDEDDETSVASADLEQWQAATAHALRLQREQIQPPRRPRQGAEIRGRRPTATIRKKIPKTRKTTSKASGKIRRIREYRPRKCKGD
jgi:hypothetical protein